MKVYRGIREGTCHVRVVERGAGSANGDGDGGATDVSYDLPPRPDLFAKPPGPFDWGSDSSGTLHLAAALLLDRGSDTRTLRALLPYVRRLLSRLPPEGFEVSDTFLDAFIYAVGAAKPAAPSGPPPAKEAPAASDTPDAPEADERTRARALDPANGVH